MGKDPLLIDPHKVDYKSLGLPHMVKSSKKSIVTKRFASFFVDLLILEFVILAPFTKLFTGMEWGNAEAISSNTMLGFIVLIMGVFALLYFSISEYLLGRTLGMMLFHLGVKEQIGFWKAITRNLYCLPIFPLQLLWIIEPIHLLWKKKRLLESWTKTNTVTQ